MSDLVLLFERLAQQALAPLLIALVASAAVVSLIRNWRVSLPALIVQSVVVGILLARVIQPSVALVRLHPYFAGALRPEPAGGAPLGLTIGAPIDTTVQSCPHSKNDRLCLSSQRVGSFQTYAFSSDQ